MHNFIIIITLYVPILLSWLKLQLGKLRVKREEFVLTD